ncbi:UNVERIFIED_CONTAM: hypothetical protein K2H54_034723 [Gekko kuhli]
MAANSDSSDYGDGQDLETIRQINLLVFGSQHALNLDKDLSCSTLAAHSYWLGMLLMYIFLLNLPSPEPCIYAFHLLGKKNIEQAAEEWNCSLSLKSHR